MALVRVCFFLILFFLNAKEYEKYKFRFVSSAPGCCC